MSILLLEWSKVITQNANPLAFLNCAGNNASEAVKASLGLIVVLLQDLDDEWPRRFPFCDQISELQSGILDLRGILQVMVVDVAPDRLLGGLDALHAVDERLYPC